MLAAGAVAVAVVAAGWLAAHWRYRSYRPPLENRASRFLLSGWQADALVDRLIVQPFAAMARFCSTGCDRTLLDGTLDGLARLVQMRRGKSSTCSIHWLRCSRG